MMQSQPMTPDDIPDYPDAVELDFVPSPRWYTRMDGRVLVTDLHPAELGDQAIADIKAAFAANASAEQSDNIGYGEWDG